MGFRVNAELKLGLILITFVPTKCSVKMFGSHVLKRKTNSYNEMNRAVCDLLYQVVDHCRLHNY